MENYGNTSSDVRLGEFILVKVERSTVKEFVWGYRFEEAGFCF